MPRAADQSSPTLGSVPDSLPKDPANSIYTAHHEAGHVMATLVCGLGFKYVTIRPDEKNPDHLGMVAKDEVPAAPDKVGTMRAAGPTAETYLRHLREAAGYDGVGPKALAQSVHTLCKRGHSELREAQLYFPGSIDAAASLVDRHWETVAALATALLESETLTFVECFDVADESGLYERFADDY